MRVPKLPLKQQLFIDFLICFVAGIILANMLGADGVQKNGSLTRYYLKQFQYTDIQVEELLWHVGCNRLVVFLLLFMFSMIPRGKYAHGLFVAWSGFAYGYFCVLSISAFGILGLVLCLLALFPHFLAYVPVYLGMLQISEHPREHKGWHRFVAVMLLLLLLIIGILLESYINPIILQKVLNFL